MNLQVANTNIKFNVSAEDLNVTMVHGDKTLYLYYQAKAARTNYSEMKNGSSLLKDEYLMCVALGECICKLIELHQPDTVLTALLQQRPSPRVAPSILERKDLLTVIVNEVEKPALLDQVYMYIGYSFLYSSSFEKVFNELVELYETATVSTLVDKVLYNKGYKAVPIRLTPFNTLEKVKAVNDAGEEIEALGGSRVLKYRGTEPYASSSIELVLDSSKVAIYFKPVKAPMRSAFVKVLIGDKYFNYGVAVVKGGSWELANNTVKAQAIGELVAYLGDIEWLNVVLDENYSDCKDTNSKEFRKLGVRFSLTGDARTNLKAFSLPLVQNGRSKPFITDTADLTGFELIASNFSTVQPPCKPSLGSASEIQGEAVIVDEVALELTPEQKRIAELEAELAKLKGGNKLVSGGLVYAMKGKIHIGSDSFPVEKGRPAIAYIGLKLLELRATVDVPIESLYVKGSNFASGTTAYGSYGIPAWTASFKDGNERKPFKEIMRIYKFVSIDTMLTDLREYLAGDFKVSEYAVNRVGLVIYLAMLVGSNSFNKLEALGFTKADYGAYNRFLVGYKACV